MSKQNLTIDTHTNACKLINTYVHKVQNIVAEPWGNTHTHIHTMHIQTHTHTHIHEACEYTRRYTNIVK